MRRFSVLVLLLCALACEAPTPALVSAGPVIDHVDPTICTGWVVAAMGLHAVPASSHWIVGTPRFARAHIGDIAITKGEAAASTVAVPSRIDSLPDELIIP